MYVISLEVQRVSVNYYIYYCEEIFITSITNWFNFKVENCDFELYYKTFFIWVAQK